MYDHDAVSSAVTWCEMNGGIRSWGVSKEWMDLKSAAEGMACRILRALAGGITSDYLAVYTVPYRNSGSMCCLRFLIFYPNLKSR